MDTSLGFAHFLAQSDGVGKTLLVLLLAMSILSWIIIALKGLAQWSRQRRRSSGWRSSKLCSHSSS